MRIDRSRLYAAWQRWWLHLSMLVAVVLVLSAATWSAAEERAAALDDFSDGQAKLAAMVGIDFEQRLLAHLAAENPRVRSASLVDEVVLDLLTGSRQLERGTDMMVMVARPDQPGFLTTDRRVIPSNRLRDALHAGQRTLTLPRDEAVAFGLPPWRAVAGLARVAQGEDGGWGVVVLASAERIRVRQRHEEWRLGLTVVTVVLLVAGVLSFAQKRQRRQLELEREVALARVDKMATVAALSTGVAHELGTPLGVIVGRVEQVRDRLAADERGRTALGIVLEQVERIQRIVRGLLALARGDAPELVQVAPATLVERALSLVRHRFDKSGVQLTADVSSGLPNVACEPALFEQALVNVLLNACQASEQGMGVNIRVASEGTHIVFVVEDEGTGIPDDDLQRATEPFFSTKREHGGTGLGLTIAREIVIHHGGTLTLARRSDGRGTRATITT